MKIFRVLLFVLLTISCSRKEVVELREISIGKSVLAKEKPEELDLLKRSKSLRIIPLEFTDSSIIGTCRLSGITQQEIIVKDRNDIYIFDLHSGDYISKFNKRGEGPTEYSSISDVAIDSVNRIFYLLDIASHKINVYTFDGEYQKSIANDSIASIELMDDGGFVTYNLPTKSCAFDLCLYDAQWKPILSMLKKKETDSPKGLILINDFTVFDHSVYTCLNDTLYNVSSKGAAPVLYLNKGSLALPIEIASNVSRKKERDSYIWGDYGLLVENLYFLKYYYDKKQFFDIWDISNGKLKYRNMMESPSDPFGISLNVNGIELSIWPNYVKDNFLYCVLNDDQVAKLMPLGNEENPVILEIAL